VLCSAVDEYWTIVATFLDHVVHWAVTLECLDHTRAVLHHHTFTVYVILNVWQKNSAISAIALTTATGHRNTPRTHLKINFVTSRSYYGNFKLVTDFVFY